LLDLIFKHAFQIVGAFVLFYIRFQTLPDSDSFVFYIPRIFCHKNLQVKEFGDQENGFDFCLFLYFYFDSNLQRF